MKTTLRIVHYHNNFTYTHGQHGEVFYKKIARKMSRCVTDRYSNYILGISDAGIASVYGDQWKSKDNIKRIYNGVPLDEFKYQAHKRNQGRLKIGISSSSFVIGHVGRFRPQKNHQFLVQLAVRLKDDLKDFVFLLIGDGPLLEATKQLVVREGLVNHFIFTGARTDISDLLQLMDSFAFPSLWEGFPLSPIEAQATGLPVLMSDTISKEVPVISPSIRLSLDHLDSWVDSCLELAQKKKDRAGLADIMQAHLQKYSMQTWVQTIQQLYVNGLREGG